MESRSYGESVGYSYSCYGGGWGGESHDEGESREEYIPAYPPYGGVYSSGESRSASESRSEPVKVINATQSKIDISSSSLYQSLESIDSLLERLDVPIAEKSPKMKKAISARMKKVAELRQLKEKLLAEIHVDEEISEIEQGNDEIDSLIKSLRNKMK